MTFLAFRGSAWTSNPATQARPAVGRKQTRHQFHRGGFPRAVGPQKAKDFAGRNIQIQPVHGQYRLKFFHQPFRFNHAIPRKKWSAVPERNGIVRLSSGETAGLRERSRRIAPSNISGRPPGGTRTSAPTAHAPQKHAKLPSTLLVPIAQRGPRCGPQTPPHRPPPSNKAWPRSRCPVPGQRGRSKNIPTTSRKFPTADEFPFRDGSRKSTDEPVVESAVSKSHRLQNSSQQRGTAQHP
jgi:hypothetical protein